MQFINASFLSEINQFDMQLPIRNQLIKVKLEISI